MGGLARGAEPAGPKGSPYVPPLPAVIAFAEKEKIPLDRIEVAANEADSRTGDSVTALITLYEGDHYRQWLLRAATLDLPAAERAAKPPPPMTLFLNTGAKFTFAGGRMALELRIAGPFRSGDSAGKIIDKRARALVNEEFLGLGFDRAAVAARSMAAAGKDDPKKAKAGLSFSTKPFPADAIAKGREQMAGLALTSEDERSMAGISPALLAFFGVVKTTPGLSDILAELLDKASLAWSALTHGGKLDPDFNIDSQGISQIETAKWGPNLPPAFRFPFLVSLNKKPTLYCQLVVTSPRPPLRASAGIIGMIVGAPNDESKVLVLRLLAGRRAEAPPAPLAPE